jgi:hypothetical protein
VAAHKNHAHVVIRHHRCEPEGEWEVSKRAKPVDVWVIKQNGVLQPDFIWELTDSGRKEAIGYANKPAGQSVVRGRLSEYVKPKRSRP